jgi:hypothetical protein
LRQEGLSQWGTHCVTMKSTVFWDVMPYSLVEAWRFEGTYTIFRHCLVCTIWGSHSDGYEQFCLLAYNSVLSAESRYVFRRNISPHSSGSKNKLSRKRAWTRHTVFWVIALCSLVGGYWRFGGISCLHVQGRSDGATEVVKQQNKFTLSTRLRQEKEHSGIW